MLRKVAQEPQTTPNPFTLDEFMFCCKHNGCLAIVNYVHQELDSVYLFVPLAIETS